MSGTAEVYADHEAGAVCVNFSGGTCFDPDTGDEVTVEPTEITLSPNAAREFAYQLTRHAYALEGDNIP